ncbi:amidase [Verticiella sediminum]|uniref:Amidase n=1 Tax=Verticiella sediminum TaxID=1247510 RepID=A0A556AJ64_9BURK|nr:amidase [Verticiella sediminum]TSH92942.1 amidase [Verticiella sediminum]
MPDDTDLTASLAGYAAWLGRRAIERAPRWVERLRMNADEIAVLRETPTPQAAAYVARPVAVLPAPADGDAPPPPPLTPEDALQRARRHADLHAFAFLPERLAPPGPGYLHNVPFAVKDLIGVAGMPRTGGSASSDPAPFPDDAAAVAAMKRQGAVVIGLANLHELAFGASSANPVFGRVVNPLTPERIPGGSSGGSAAAVAAGIVDIALATDTGGSVRIPAACCGVVGFKPSYDAVPRTGTIDVSVSLDHIGPIGRTVMDCARAFAALIGEPVFTGLSDAPLRGVRVGVLKGFFSAPLEPSVRAAVAAAADTFAADGARVAEMDVPGIELAPAIQFATISSEAAAALEARLLDAADRLGEDVRVRLEMADFLPGHWYVKAQRLRRQLVDRMLACLDDADVLLCPVMRVPAPRVGAADMQIEGVRYPLHTAVSNLTLPFSLSGMPAIALPWGRTADGAALSVQIVGAPGHDWQVLQVAHRLERLFGQGQRQAAQPPAS